MFKFTTIDMCPLSDNWLLVSKDLRKNITQVSRDDLGKWDISKGKYDGNPSFSFSDALGECKDGGLVLVDKSRKQGSGPVIPLAPFEVSITPWTRRHVIDTEQAKRRNATGKVLHTGEEEEYNTERAAQEFAEFLAQALAHHRRTR